MLGYVWFPQLVLCVIIRTHRITCQMRPIDTDGVAWSVCLSVCNVDRKPHKTAKMTAVWYYVDCGLGWAQLGTIGLY